MSVATKKLLYFLLAGDCQRARRFLLKNPRPLAENKAFPARFIKKTRKAFLAKPRPQQKSLPADRLLSCWRGFCENTPYEEVLPLILWGILQYPLKKISYILKISPEVLSFRLKSAVLSLEEYLTADSSIKKADLSGGRLQAKDPAQVFLPEEDFIKKNDSLSIVPKYLSALAKQNPPEELQQISLVSNGKVRYILPVLGAVIVFFLVVGIWLFFASSAEKVLYRSFLNDF